MSTSVTHLSAGKADHDTEPIFAVAPNRVQLPRIDMCSSLSKIAAVSRNLYRTDSLDYFSRNVTAIMRFCDCQTAIFCPFTELPWRSYGPSTPRVVTCVTAARQTLALACGQNGGTSSIAEALSGVTYSSLIHRESNREGLKVGLGGPPSHPWGFIWDVCGATRHAPLLAVPSRGQV